jgi:HAD superfamily hydrolase (TIGR01549 family)
LASHEIKAVIFDLGETLLNFGRVDAGALFKEAARRSYAFLREAGQPVGPYAFYLFRSLGSLRMRAFLSEITGNDFDSRAVLRGYGENRGFDLTEAQWRQMNWLWYEPLYEIANVEATLAQTLGVLREQGLKLAILSNTFVNADSLEEHLGREGVLDFFEVRMYSYQFAFRKPDKRIFLEAAERVGCHPSEIVYVGDRIDKDVNGSSRAGMTPVLKTAYTNEGKKVPAGVAKIDSIAELPQVISSLNDRRPCGVHG